MLQTDLYSFSYKKGAVAPYCKRCGSSHLHRDGKDKRNQQVRRCRECGFRFVWTSDLPRRNYFSNVIAFATELYTTTGVSLRTLAKKLLEYFDIKISHEGIRRWVLDSKNLVIDEDLVEATKTWHIDETYIKIQGKGYWLWVIYCAESKHVLAWHMSKTRLLKDAKKVLNKALKQSKGVKPETIITDGLWQYPVAIYKTMKWNWKTQKQIHIIDSGIGKNSPVERTNREIKRRIKWFSTFQALQGAKCFFGLFFYHWNKNRPVNSSELT